MRSLQREGGLPVHLFNVIDDPRIGGMTALTLVSHRKLMNIQVARGAVGFGIQG